MSPAPASNRAVTAALPADLITPLGAYLRLAEDGAPAFLLESVEGGVTMGRYSIVGCGAECLFEHRGGQTRLVIDGQETFPEGNPLDVLKELIARSRIDLPDDLPPQAASGLFGYLGYDMVRYMERIPDTNPDPLSIPDARLIRPRLLAIFDHVRQTITLVAPEYGGDTSGAARIEAALERLNRPLADNARISRLQSGSRDGSSPVHAALAPGQYQDLVRRAQEYIRAGDIFQVVLSQRFSLPFDGSAVALYRSLRRLNPSPFLFLLSFADFALIGSSPEVLVRVRGGTVTIRPIAGTRPRGANEAEDQALAEGLLADPKERSEHLMLLDLARNDVGRVAEIGSVRVSNPFSVERYSHVMHIVSTVEGQLKGGLTALDALVSGFPAGTVSGAPKIRAMEIIDELEPLRRGYYGGCVGYFSGNGDLDCCIALRTGLLKDGVLTVQAGAGLVADSQPDSEDLECRNKAMALIRAAQTTP